MIKDNWCAPSVSKLARNLKDAVKDLWDNRDEGGCYHWPIYYEEDGKEWDVVLGWDEGYDEDPNIYYENGCAICASVRYQTAHNAMQTDLNIDFLMPCNEDGDCWDADVTVSRDENFNALAKYLLDEGKKMVEEYADKDDEEDDEEDDDEEDEDFDESRQRRGHMLHEHSTRHGRLITENDEAYTEGEYRYTPFELALAALKQLEQLKKLVVGQKFSVELAKRLERITGSYIEINGGPWKYEKDGFYSEPWDGTDEEISWIRIEEYKNLDYIYLYRKNGEDEVLSNNIYFDVVNEYWDGTGWAYDEESSDFDSISEEDLKNYIHASERTVHESSCYHGRMLRETYDIEVYPHVYIGRTDEYYNEDYDDDSVFGNSYEWWTWSEEADDSNFAKEGPVFELTEDGKEDFFVWLDAEQVGPNLGDGRMKDWPKTHLSSEDEWEYLTSPKNGLSKKLSVNESRRPRGRMSKF